MEDQSKKITLADILKNSQGVIVGDGSEVTHVYKDGKIVPVEKEGQ